MKLSNLKMSSNVVNKFYNGYTHKKNVKHKIKMSFHYNEAAIKNRVGGIEVV